MLGNWFFLRNKKLGEYTELEEWLNLNTATLFRIDVSDENNPHFNGSYRFEEIDPQMGQLLDEGYMSYPEQDDRDEKLLALVKAFLKKKASFAELKRFVNRYF